MVFVQNHCQMMAEFPLVRVTGRGKGGFEQGPLEIAVETAPVEDDGGTKTRQRALVFLIERKGLLRGLAA
jgi:hypothetical protein